MTLSNLDVEILPAVYILKRRNYDPPPEKYSIENLVWYRSIRMEYRIMLFIKP